ncbi:hypothetical protein KBC04_03525 [Candidatus Babeliales bacterium]|nr:hypothetical protein [Candidatus Babeliales bacterium]MBP9843878.1 hypothetical protein [Candidatus Babeliales bacterium]
MIKNFKNYSMPHQKSRKLFLAALAVMTASTLSATSSDVSISKNLFLQRAFSANTTRELLMEGHVIPTDFDGFYSFFSMDGAYQHSWNQGSEEFGLGAFPFWSGTNVMTTGNNDARSNLDVYQFGLYNVTTPGSITLNPIVYQGGADFLLYFGASTNDPGTFLKLKVPLGIIGINPQLTEIDPILSATSYPAGALSQSNNPVNDPALTMTQAFAGNLVGGQLINGSNFIPMQFGLLNGTQLSGTQFGDFEMALGYNFVCNEDYLFGVALRASGPSANKPTGQFLLEPVFGRGGSWTVGGYVVGKAKLWENHESSYLNLNVMATILHLVKKTDTIRSYDLLANGPGSKYLLVADYNGNSYQGTVQNLINLSTLSTNSSFSAEGDISIDLSYINNGWSADFGYNFWGRTQEILSISGTFPANRYAILGRQPVGNPTGDINVCQPTATINSSVAPYSGTGPLPEGVVDATVPSNRIGGNYVFDVAGAQQSSTATSKLFAKTSYSWLESHFSPHLGIAGEFEMSTGANNALPQWAVSLIGGMYF